MRFWWVNQNRTFRSEIEGGFLWSPKTRKDGARNQFYENMTQVEPGDVVFSFCDTRIKALGRATARAQTAQKPEFGASGDAWASEGWLVDVDYTELASTPRPKDHIDLIRPHLPSKYAPLRGNGNGLQSVYLAEVPAPMAEVLFELVGREAKPFREPVDAVDENSESENEHEAALTGRTDIPATTKEQLVRSRRGQGVFRKNVRLREKRCRVTGVSEMLHLIASHIKPWKDSSDVEKLSGCNGLLLAPHVDHLFDKGWISFADDGELLVSPRLDPALLTKWGIPFPLHVGAFSQEQAVFLAWHRKNTLKG